MVRETEQDWKTKAYKMDEVQHFLTHEVESTLKEAKIGKMKGPDGVENETLKIYAEVLAPPPHKNL